MSSKQQELRDYNRLAQQKFIKENPNYYKQQYQKHKEYRLKKAKEKYQQKKLELEKEKQKEKQKENTLSFAERALNAYAEKIIKQNLQPNLTNGNIVFICVPEPA